MSTVLLTRHRMMLPMILQECLELDSEQMHLEDHLELSFWDLQAQADQLKLVLLLKDMVLFTFVLDHFLRMRSVKIQVLVR